MPYSCSCFMSSKLSLGLFVAAEILLCIIIYVPLLALQFISPFQSGIFPNDQSISYPKKENTVSLVLAGFFALGTPLLAIIMIEILVGYFSKFPRDQKSGQPIVIIHLYRFIGMVALSFGAMLLIVQIGKETIGSLRPFFLTVCEPILGSTNSFMETVTCSSGNEKQINEARMSFPSGHSACGAYGAFFTSIYLQLRMPRWPVGNLKAFIQVTVVAIGFYICLTRIQDNWHRPIDVIVGSLLGLLAAMQIFWLPIGTTLVIEAERPPNLESVGLTKAQSHRRYKSELSSPDPIHLSE